MRHTVCEYRIAFSTWLWIGRGGKGGDSAVAGEEEGGEAEAVGAVEAGVGGGEAGDDFGAGMAEGVPGTDGDDGGLRCHQRQKIRGGGSAAAVVANFEQGVGAERSGGVPAERGGDHGAFAGGFSVAF